MSSDTSYRWNLEYDTNEPKKQKHTQGQRKQTDGCRSQGGGREVGGETEQEIGVSRRDFHVWNE